MEGKKDTDKWFPVVLVDDDDFLTMKTGVAFGDVACKFSFEGATGLTTHTVTTAEWKEGGEGKYWLLIGASEFTSVGKYEVSVTVADAIIYNFAVEVLTQTQEEFQSGTVAEPAAGNPTNTPTIKDMINHLYRKIIKDKVTYDGTTETTFKNDGSTGRFKNTVTDAAGTTTRGASAAV